MVTVSVPETRLGTCDGQVLAVSKLWGAKSLDVRALNASSPQYCASDAFRAALRAASGLLAFHAWLGTGDLKDEHVMVRGSTPGEYQVASIDFASAFGWDASGGAVALPPGPPILVAVANRDPTVVNETIARIEAIADEQIRAIVRGLPDEVLSPAEKERICRGLLARRGAIRAVFQGAGWI